MTPRELKSLMARTRSSSLMLGEPLGISAGADQEMVRRRPAHSRASSRQDRSVLSRAWRAASGDAADDRSERDRAGAVSHRVTITPRDDPLPPANGTTICEAINSFVAALAPRRRADPVLAPSPAQAGAAVPTARPQPLNLFRRDDHGQPARSITQPQATQPQLLDAMPLGPPQEPFSAPRGPRCRWPHTDTPGAPSGQCE
jgi:hypothetical protein